MKNFVAVRSMLLVLTFLVLLPLMTISGVGCSGGTSQDELIDKFARNPIGRLVLRLGYDAVRTYLADPTNDVGIIIPLEDRAIIEEYVYDKILEIFPFLEESTALDYINLSKFISTVFRSFIWPYTDDLKIPGIGGFGATWDSATLGLIGESGPYRAPADPVDIGSISDGEWAEMVADSLE